MASATIAKGWRVLKYVLGLLAAFVLSTGPALADPEPMKVALTYDGRLFIKVLDIQFNQTIGAAGYGSSVRMRSYGVLALFKRFNIEAASQGRLTAASEPHPLTFGYTNRDGERVRQVKVAWQPGDVTMASTPPFDNLGTPPASREQKLAAGDPLSEFVAVALSHKPTSACGESLRFFDGKQLYDLIFGAPQAASFGDREQALGLVSPVQCEVRYQEVAGFKPKPPAKRNQGLKSPIEAVMGRLGEGGPWVIASLSADTNLGKARIVLSHAQISGGRP